MSDAGDIQHFRSEPHYFFFILRRWLDSWTGGRRGDVRQLLLQLLIIFPPKWAERQCYTEISDSVRRITTRIRKDREQLWPCSVYSSPLLPPFLSLFRFLRIPPFKTGSLTHSAAKFYTTSEFICSHFTVCLHSFAVILVQYSLVQSLVGNCQW